MADDTGTPAVDDQGNPIVVEDPAFSPKQEEFIGKMLDKQAAQLTSHFGRISKEQVNKSFEGGIDQEKLNDQLSTKFLTNVEGTFNELLDKREADNKKIRDEKLEAISTEMEKFSDKPLFKETEDAVRKIAEEAIGKGFPPGPAVELAVEKAKSSFLMNRDPEYKLDMSGPGKQIPRVKEKKMPEALKAAANRDIASGLFKDEAEYINELAPHIKEKYGL